MYLTIREIITIRSICYSNNTAAFYSQCISILRFLERSEDISLNSIKNSVLIIGNMAAYREVRV